ncbi:MAG: cytochrome b/b6 domain-containing protein [Hasllibacter sp.]
MIRRRLPRRRTWLKAMHWTLVPLFAWFLLVTPSDVARIGPWAVALHSDLGLAFTALSVIWVIDYWARGLASRPGPKLPPWARRVHWWMHRGLVIGLGVLALTGFALGLTSSRLLLAGGFVPIAPPLGLPEANEVAGTVHFTWFYGLAALAAGHAAFHLWRHFRLRDNALRIMAPRALHRFL